MHRNNAYNEELAKQLEDQEFAREYFLALVEGDEEPISIEEALRMVIPQMGVAEHCRTISKSKTDVDKFLRGERNLKRDTLNEYLKPFDLVAKLVLEKVA
jgi:DNA-binding phage protein